MTSKAFPSASTASTSAGAEAVKPGEENALAENIASNTRLDALHDLLGVKYDVQSTTASSGATAVQNNIADEDTNDNNAPLKGAWRWKYERAY